MVVEDFFSVASYSKAETKETEGKKKRKREREKRGKQKPGGREIRGMGMNLIGHRYVRGHMMLKLHLRMKDCESVRMRV
jgi:hypothetical protein